MKRRKYCSPMWMNSSQLQRFFPLRQSCPICLHFIVSTVTQRSNFIFTFETFIFFLLHIFAFPASRLDAEWLELSGFTIENKEHSQNNMELILNLLKHLVERARKRENNAFLMRFQHKWKFEICVQFSCEARGENAEVRWKSDALMLSNVIWAQAPRPSMTLN